MLTCSPCTLCQTDAFTFYNANLRHYFRCPLCHLIFLDPQGWLSPEEELAHYCLHENDPADERYRRFLSRLFEPLQSRLEPRSEGLDFGSGPGPTLSLMFEEAGYSMQIYDPYFAPHRDVLSRQYHFVTASEVVEHFHQPRVELDLLWSLLRPGGWLGLMTQRFIEGRSFADWHYRLDPTHVSFFSESTLAFLAEKWNTDLEVMGPDVVLFQKK